MVTCTEILEISKILCCSTISHDFSLNTYFSFTWNSENYLLLQVHRKNKSEPENSSVPFCQLMMKNSYCVFPYTSRPVYKPSLRLFWEKSSKTENPYIRQYLKKKRKRKSDDKFNSNNV